MLDKSKYCLSEVVEGKGWRLTEIKVTRSDFNPISNNEVKDLLSEFERFFPSETYRIQYETKPEEDDVVLHIYLNFTVEETLRRSKTMGARLIVPKEEVEERLRDW